MIDNQNYIPRHINSGAMILLWEADTVILVVTTCLIFSMLGSFILGAILAFILVRGWIRLKEEGGAGLITRLIFWFTYSRFMFRGSNVGSEVKEYIG